MKKAILMLMVLASCSSNKNLTYNEAMEKNDKKLTSVEMQQDARFLVDAKSYSLLLMNLGRLGSTNGYANVISDYGSKILADHNTLNEELESLAESKEMLIPVSMSQEHQNIYEELKNADRRDFDRKFIQTAERIYEDNIQMYKTVATTGDNDDLRAFAAKKLSMLRKNEEQADNLEDEII